VVVFIVGLLGYIVCGFFLRPVEKNPFLSVLSVAVVLVLVFIFFLSQSSYTAGESGWNYCNRQISAHILNESKKW